MPQGVEHHLVAKARASTEPVTTASRGQALSVPMEVVALRAALSRRAVVRGRQAGLPCTHGISAEASHQPHARPGPRGRLPAGL
jgi:hypothetical protein